MEAFLKREPVYDGFNKTGEVLSCSACGAVFPSEENVPFKARNKTPEIFTDADRPETPDIFIEGENRVICRYCASYVINPFMQFCAHHKKEIQATDTCSDFSLAPENPAPPVF